MSDTYKNIKIPYPSEGVIRTAALDDTVAPTDSVQVAVNLNFDRIGASQTRNGVQEYADELFAPIRNFGTLNNSFFPHGFQNIKQLSTGNLIDDAALDTIGVKVDDTHYLLFWGGNSGAFAQVTKVDAGSGNFTLLGTALNFDVDTSGEFSAKQIDANHYICFWQGGGSQHGFVQVFNVNLVTFEVTALDVPLEFIAAFNAFNSCQQVDTDHYINFWSGMTDANAQVIEVNLTTFAVTALGSPFQFEAAEPAFYNSSGVISASKFINFWDALTSTDGRARVFDVDGSYNVTAAGAQFTFDATGGSFNSCAMVDANHFINFWRGASTGHAGVFAINLGTWAITAVGTPYDFSNAGNSAVSMGDGIHFVDFYIVSGSDGMVRVFEVDGGTYTVSPSSDAYKFSEIDSDNFALFVNDHTVINLWNNTNTQPGQTEGGMFVLFDDLVTQNFLYAQRGDLDVLNWPNPGWTVRRTGLTPGSGKARFTQYLNYIWMVNGNASIGDPVETSNGGNFGTDLVPAGFPPGDFIQAGFEGRVWVADKLYDVVYFTDIVQFTPPDLYTLSYNAAANFIKNFSPQNGQTITGLFTTPRALLLFKQDSIYRIYGAFSVDAYPAYNVGTYSQESIVQTKDGIYFHHSSGFYKFAYDSQPVEISRRVIDFIKAIPRSYYEQITGIYNGNDAVEWHVGTITVEGVTYESCVMRYTISTQVWTIYDYRGNDITAMILYDDGSRINMIMGASQP